MWKNRTNGEFAYRQQIFPLKKKINMNTQGKQARKRYMWNGI